MENSPLNRLAGELRNPIYDMIFAQGRGLIIGPYNGFDGEVRAHLDNYTSLGKMLALSQFCQKMRAEARLLDINDIVFAGFDLFLEKDDPDPSAAAWLRELAQIPRSLVSDNTIHVIFARCDIGKCNRRFFDCQFGSERTCGLPTKQLLDALDPKTTFLEIQFRTHTWSADLRGSESELPLQSKALCNKGAPLTCNDCGRVAYRVPFGDPKTAKEEARRQLKVHVGLIETHKKHKACPIRVEILALVEGLEESYKVMEQVIDHAMEGLRVDGGAAGAASATVGQEANGV